VLLCMHLVAAGIHIHDDLIICNAAKDQLTCCLMVVWASFPVHALQLRMPRPPRMLTCWHGVALQEKITAAVDKITPHRKYAAADPAACMRHYWNYDATTIACGHNSAHAQQNAHAGRVHGQFVHLCSAAGRMAPRAPAHPTRLAPRGMAPRTRTPPHRRRCCCNAALQPR
jgi:hypothetical protein